METAASLSDARAFLRCNTHASCLAQRSMAYLIQPRTSRAYWHVGFELKPRLMLQSMPFKSHLHVRQIPHSLVSYQWYATCMSLSVLTPGDDTRCGSSRQCAR